MTLSKQLVSVYTFIFESHVLAYSGALMCMHGAYDEARGHPRCQPSFLSEAGSLIGLKLHGLSSRALPSFASHLILAGMTDDQHTWLILDSRDQACWGSALSPQFV